LPPASGTTVSSCPWISSTDTGDDGAHVVGPAPEMLTMAATLSAWSQATRYARKPPFENPTRYTRFGSIFSGAPFFSFSSMSARIAPTSSGFLRSKSQQAAVAFQYV
jgi:hypothetical protein